jgi:hypothetical protein
LRAKSLSIFSVLLLGLVLASCDLFSESENPFIYQNVDKTVTIVSANPVPSDISEDGFTFNVSINLPNDKEGYYVWVKPSDYISPEANWNEYLTCWYNPSEMLSPTSDDIVRGGWLLKYSNNNYSKLTKGTVFSWNVKVAYKKADDSWETVFEHDFNYTVKVE